MALPMRRFTLLTIVVLFAVLTAATVYQVLLVRGKPRQYVGPGLSPPPGAVILRNLTGRDREDVIAELEDAGVRYRVRAVGGTDDVVVEHEPGPGVFVGRDTVVRLDVTCEPAPCPSPPPGEEIVDPCGCATA